MKAILEFNLPDDSAEHIRAVHAMHAWGSLDEIRNMIRNHLKYDGDDAKAAILITNIQHIAIEAQSWIGE